MSAVERAAEVLVAHQRVGAHSCLCGDLPLGSSFAKHQAEALAAEGLLVAADPGPTVQAFYGDEL